MKSLYESILTSTASGKEKVAEPVKKWFLSCYYRFIGVNEDDITLEPYKDMWKIYIKTKNAPTYFRFDKSDSNGTGVLPYKIYGIYVNGKPIDINYTRLNFESSDDFAQEVNKNITFYGCKIKKIKQLPKNCKEVSFYYGHAIGGGTPTTIEEIEKIDVDYFITIGTTKSKMGLSCRLSKIKGITVNKRFEICDSMLGYYSLEKGNRIFLQDSSDMLDEFFKNNKVDPANCVFNSNDGKIGDIKFDKKINRWRFKPYRE